MESPADKEKIYATGQIYFAKAALSQKNVPLNADLAQE